MSVRWNNRKCFLLHPFSQDYYQENSVQIKPRSIKCHPTSPTWDIHWPSQRCLSSAYLLHLHRGDPLTLVTGPGWKRRWKSGWRVSRKDPVIFNVSVWTLLLPLLLLLLLRVQNCLSVKAKVKKRKKLNTQSSKQAKKINLNFLTWRNAKNENKIKQKKKVLSSPLFFPPKKSDAQFFCPFFSLRPSGISLGLSITLIKLCSLIKRHFNRQVAGNRLGWIARNKCWTNMEENERDLRRWTGGDLQ